MPVLQEAKYAWHSLIFVYFLIICLMVNHILMLLFYKPYVHWNRVCENRPWEDRKQVIVMRQISSKPVAKTQSLYVSVQIWNIWLGLARFETCFHFRQKWVCLILSSFVIFDMLMSDFAWFDSRINQIKQNNWWVWHLNLGSTEISFSLFSLVLLSCSIATDWSSGIENFFCA